MYRDHLDSHLRSVKALSNAITIVSRNIFCPLILSSYLNNRFPEYICLSLSMIFPHCGFFPLRHCRDWTWLVGRMAESWQAD